MNIQTIPAQTMQSVGRVGTIGTYQGVQYKIRSVEGYDYYAFISSAGTGEITCDFDMHPAPWKTEPLAFLLPMGAKMGEGFGVEVPLRYVRRGVSLAKRAI